MKAKSGIFILRFFALFPLSVLQKFGIVLGYLNWKLGSKSAYITQTNLTLCYPGLDEEQHKELTIKSLQETFTTILQVGPIWLWPVDKVLSKLYTVEGFDKLKTAYEQDKGLIIIAPHLGNWEFLGLYFDRCGLGKINTLYQPPKNRQMEQFIVNARSRAGNKLVPTNQRGVVTTMRALGKSEVVCILPDQVPPLSSGEYARFYGVEAFSMTLLSRLLRKTGARAVFATALRVRGDKGDGFKVVIREAEAEVYAEHMPTSLQAINDSIEALVREVPEQYQWEYKRFKRVNSDEAKVY